MTSSDFLKAAGQSLLADAAPEPHQLRRLPLSELFRLRRQPLFHRPGYACQGWAADKDPNAPNATGATTPATWTTARSTKAASPCCTRPISGAGSGTRGQGGRLCGGQQPLAAGLCPVHGLQAALRHEGVDGVARTRTSACDKRGRSGEVPSAAGRTMCSSSPICSSCSSPQWELLRDYVHRQGIRIIGDLPIYVSPGLRRRVGGAGSFSSWTRSWCPSQVAGVPPDYFTADGQLWGNPLYDWDAMREDGFGWWIRRIDGAGKLYRCHPHRPLPWLCQLLGGALRRDHRQERSLGHRARAWI